MGCINGKVGSCRSDSELEEKLIDDLNGSNINKERWELNHHNASCSQKNIYACADIASDQKTDISELKNGERSWSQIVRKINLAGFPDQLGPFETPITTFTETCFHMLNCSGNNDDQRFFIMYREALDRCKNLESVISNFPLVGQTSALYPITLDNVKRAMLNIPANARYAAWVYPVVVEWRIDGCANENIIIEKIKRMKLLRNPDLLFLLLGGHFYFDDKYKIVAVNAIRMPQDEWSKRDMLFEGKGMNFSGPAKFESKYIDKLIREDRFKLDPLIDSKDGAKFFAWLLPEETIFSADRDSMTVGKHGAFAYLFSELLQREEEACKKNCYFNVVCQDSNCCVEASDLPRNWEWPSKNPMRRMSTDPQLKLSSPSRARIKNQGCVRTRPLSCFDNPLLTKEASNTMPMSARGVPLVVLQDLAREYRKLRDLQQDMREKNPQRTPIWGEILVEQIIKPKTKESRLSYAEHLKQNNDEVDVYQVTAYVCHSWKQDFSETVEAIEKFENDRKSYGNYYFCDFISINHWSKDEVSEIQELLTLLVNDARETLLVCPLDRSLDELWVIVEIAQALSCRTNLFIIQSTSQSENLTSEIKNNFQKVLSAAEEVDPGKAWASSEAVSRDLLGVIDSNMGGLARCTLSVQDFIRHSLGDKVFQVYQSLDEKSDVLDFSPTAVDFLMEGTEAHMREALEICTFWIDNWKGNSDRVIRFRARRAKLFCKLEQLGLSEQETRETLKYIQNKGWNLHDTIIELLQVLAEVLSKLGNGKEAEMAQTRAKQLSKRWYGLESEQFVESRKRLGLLHMKHEHWETAWKILEDHFACLRHTENSEKAVTKLRIAMCISKLGKVKDANGLVKRWVFLLKKSVLKSQQEISEVIWIYNQIKGNREKISSSGPLGSSTGKTAMKPLLESEEMFSYVELSCESNIEDLTDFFEPAKTGLNIIQCSTEVSILKLTNSHYPRISAQNRADGKAAYTERSLSTLKDRKRVNIEFSKILMRQILEMKQDAEEMGKLFLWSLPKYVESKVRAMPEAAAISEKYANRTSRRHHFRQETYSDREGFIEKFEKEFLQSFKILCKTANKDTIKIEQQMVEELKLSFHYTVKNNKQIQAELWALSKEDSWMKRRSILLHRVIRSHFKAEDSKCIANDYLTKLILEFVWPKLPIPFFDTYKTTDFKVDDLVVVSSGPGHKHDKAPAKILKLNEDTALLKNLKDESEVDIKSICRAFTWKCWRCDKENPKLWREVYPTKRWISCIECGLTTIKLGLSGPRYIKLDLRSKCQFGDIYFGYDWYCAENVAIKKCDRRAMKHRARQDNNQRAQEDFLKEIKMLKNLEHPGIVKMRDEYKNDREVNLILEWADGGDMWNYVDSHFKKSKVKCSKSDIKSWQSEMQRMFENICSAIAYLHRKNIAHRDIGMENILLVTDKKCRENPYEEPNLIAKVCDFGLAIQDDDLRFYETVGKTRYWSPECEWRNYDGKANDVWCLGVTMFVMLIGGHPYDAIEDAKYKCILEHGMYEFVKRNGKEHLVTSDAMEILQQIFVRESDRISCEKILRMNWCNEIRYDFSSIPSLDS